MQKTIGPLFEHACHEGNYGLNNTLAGARAEEKRAAEEAAQRAVEMRGRPYENECARVVIAGVGVLLAAAPAVGASRILGGIRRQQADQAAGHAREMGDDQSPLMVPHRRERSGRQSRQLG